MSENKTGRIKITFDKKELKARAFKFTYREARRHVGDLYKTLVQELLEDGCLITAKYFELLVSKENDYYVKHVIRDRVQDYPELLMSLYDNCKMAERSAVLKQCEGMVVTFNRLYQILALLDKPQYSQKFNWLRKDVYEIVIKICSKLGKDMRNVDKPMAQIYLRYANFLSSANESLSQSMAYYELAMHLAETNKWLIDTMNPDAIGNSLRYLHNMVADHYVDALLNFAKTIATNDYLQAVALCRKAVCVLTKVGRNVGNLHQFVNAQLHMVEFYIEGAADYNMAFSILANIDADMKKIDHKHYDKLALRLYLNKGICYTKLGLRDNAMDNLQHALQLSQKLQSKSDEALAYMNMGKLYLQEGAQERIYAKNAFSNAQLLYEKLGDRINRQKCIYLTAQVTTAGLFPLFLDLMKQSEKTGNLFHLRRWQYQLKPFWEPENFEDEGNDELTCLLKEFVRKPKAKDLLHI
ncbi:uncharacterized protein LOC142229261 [Haematobia irritans]|uniref:uncharacterized protein LOC142229261 n=1 Tax=Haematobia irritans TaxID=7368 RepID=UPI003F4F4EF5